MITGIHALIYSRDAEATRAFVRDALAFDSVDAGHGWLIFALPPAELGIHPADDEPRSELYLMCRGLDETLARLEAAGAERRGPITNQRWGRVTMLRIPGEVDIGLYEAKHPTALDLAVARAGEFRARDRAG